MVLEALDKPHLDFIFRTQFQPCINEENADLGKLKKDSHEPLEQIDSPSPREGLKGHFQPLL